MGCASSKPATPKQKLDNNPKGEKEQHVPSKVRALPHPRRCRSDGAGDVHFRSPGSVYRLEPGAHDRAYVKLSRSNHIS